MTCYENDQPVHFSAFSGYLNHFSFMKASNVSFMQVWATALLSLKSFLLLSGSIIKSVSKSVTKSIIPSKI